MRSAPDDWRWAPADAISTKALTQQLDAILRTIRGFTPDEPLTQLDVGCGSGRVSAWMRALVFSVLGVDINPAAIEAARSLAAAADSAGRWCQAASTGRLCSAHAHRHPRGRRRPE